MSDGEQILGIKDQGVGGVLISVAKLALTTLCAGIHPNRTLPVVLDCGTNNEDLLNDDLYLGLREKRVRGEQYDKFVDTFVKAARELYPRAYIHFEDFGLDNGKCSPTLSSPLSRFHAVGLILSRAARRILDRYSPKIPCFNDDVQGTGCVTLAAIMSGLHVAGQKLSDMRVVIFGSGSAGCGIADQIRDAIVAESNCSRQEAAKQIWYVLPLSLSHKLLRALFVTTPYIRLTLFSYRLIDEPGLLTTDTPLNHAQEFFAKPKEDWDGRSTDLQGVIKEVHPNVLIGTSTKSGSFTEDIIKEMASHVDRPIIMPLSNPTRLHEAAPADLLKWTEGRALVATGSPFEPVKGAWGKDGEEIEIQVAECNNSVVFPGIGLGAILCRAKLVTDKMLVAAVEAVAEMSPALKDGTAPLVPGVDAVRDVSVNVARKVIRAAEKEGLATEEGIPGGDEELKEWIREQMWNPVYRPLKYVNPKGASRQAKGELGMVGSVER